MIPYRPLEGNKPGCYLYNNTMTIPLNKREENAWAMVADVLAPDGTLDPHACALYLRQHLQTRGAYHGMLADIHVLYAILKKAPGIPESNELFVRLYRALRVDGNLTPLMTSLGEHQPHILRDWLLSCRSGANTTIRIGVLHDAKRYLPGESLKNYLSGSWERISHRGFSKSFSPAVEEIPYLMAVALEMQLDSDPRLRSLSELLQQGCFVATYKSSPGNYTTVYNAVAAFQLAERMQPAVSVAKLFELVGHRLKGESLIADALEYVVMTLEDVSEVSLAKDVFWEVLRNEDIASSGTRYYEGYAKLYGLTKHREGWETEHQALIDRVLDYVASGPSTPKNSLPEPTRNLYYNAVVVSSQPHTPWRYQAIRGCDADLILRMLHRSVDSTHDEQHQQVLRSYLFPSAGVAHPYTGVHYLATTSHATLLLDMVTPDEILQVFSDELMRILDEMRHVENLDRSNRFLRDGMLHALGQLTHILRTEHTGQDAFREKLAHSLLLPKIVLTYCMAEALGNTTDSSLYMRGLLPNLQLQPFPLLRTVYPEHDHLWRASQLHMLSQSVEYMRTGMPQVMERIFDTFAKAYIGEQTPMRGILEMGNVLSMHPTLALQSVLDKTPLASVPHLDMAVFDFGNI